MKQPAGNVCCLIHSAHLRNCGRRLGAGADDGNGHDDDGDQRLDQMEMWKRAGMQQQQRRTWQQTAWDDETT